MTILILKFYFAINLLLALSYILFLAGRRVCGLMRWSISYLHLNRVAQLLVVTAVVSPILFVALPRTTIPDVKISVRAPLADSLSSKKTKTKPAVFEVSRSVKESEYNRPMPTSKVSVELGFFVALGFGILLAFARLAQNLLRLKTILKNSVLIRGLGKIRILVSDEIKIPFSTLIGPGASIVLPTETVSQSKDMAIIIHHEIHHHRNGDTLWILWMEFASCLFVFNPFIYFWKKQITEIQEFACDEKLISQMRVSMRDYGQCLVHVAESARGLYSTQVGTTCMGAGPKGPQELKSFLRRRIEVFQDHQKSHKRGLVGYVLGTVAIIVTAGFAYGAQKSLRSDVVIKPNVGTAKFDPDIQKTTEVILKKYVTKFGAKGGFVLVADSQSGRVLAVANQISNPGSRKKSWALSYEMEPASVMKGVVAASAMDHGLIQADEKLDCGNGKYNYGGRVYRDWKPFGPLTTTETIANSSNICGIKIGEKLGAKGLEESLKAFGFGPNGVASEFPEAMPGHYPNAGELPETDYIPLISTGYTKTPGFHVTPLEVLQAYGAIANEGKLMKPMDFSDSSSGIVMKQAISVVTAQKMKVVLADAVKNGTGKNAQSSLYSTAGKTSTAYSPESSEHHNLGGERGIAGFVGFAPVQNPRLVVYVGVIDPTNSYDRNPHGNEHAAPIFKEVIETVLQKMNVSSDKASL